jgi:hypothetical protein
MKNSLKINPSSAPAIGFTLRTGTFTGIDVAFAATLEQAYPTVNVGRALNCAALQLIANPTKRMREPLAHILRVLDDIEANDLKAHQRREAAAEKKALRAASSRKVAMLPSA